MTQALAPETRRPRRWWRILKRLLIVVIVLLLVLIYGVLPYGFARLVTSAGTRPLDKALTNTPATYGATFQDVEFQTADGVKISGWLLPSRDKRTTIIFSHG